MKTIYKIWVILLIAGLIPLTGFSNDFKVQLDSAAANYQATHYEKAIAIYENIVAQGYHSSELYYNLGNAYYKSNKFPMAIVNYERALKLNPNDEDAKFNLQLANTHVVDKIDVLPEFFLKTWGQSFIQSLNSNQWAILSLLSFIVALGLFLLFFLTDRAMLRKFSFWIGTLLVVITLLSFTYARKQKNLAQNEPDAIVISPSVVVKGSPDENSTDLFLMHEGLKIRVSRKLDNNWSEIKLSDGNKGWVKNSDFVII
jgi:tetratricopeptide (TPR) repeat protein